MPAKLIFPNLLTPLHISINLKHQLFLIIDILPSFTLCFLFTEELLLENLKAVSLSGFWLQMCYLIIITSEYHLTGKDILEQEIN